MSSFSPCSIVVVHVATSIESGSNMKRIILTGGGSAGHVTPNLALIPRLMALGFEIHYVGRKSGIERELVEAIDVPYHSISAGKLRRYFDFQNFTDVFRVIRGFVQSVLLIRKLRPDILFSKGGFVACPLVWAAWVYHVPIVIHESDITPGLANKLSTPFASRICFSFSETASKLPAGKAVYTGIPIREVLLMGDRTKGEKICGFTDPKPVVLVMGGSRGSECINKTTRAALDQLLPEFNICHVCGYHGVDAALIGRSGYKQLEYVKQEQPHLFAIADIVVSRAGATTLFELLKLRKANVLVPLSRRASRGDQILNAKSFEARGLSYVLMEEELTIDSLVESITRAYSSRATMIEAMRSVSSANSIDKVVKVIQDCMITAYGEVHP